MFGKRIYRNMIQNIYSQNLNFQCLALLLLKQIIIFLVFIATTTYDTRLMMLTMYTTCARARCIAAIIIYS